ncbi:MAG: hypothetical protein DRI48_05890 [Chloroflexi bacterium]|nr:MAG: hypothetical protein DRI48_05890 [Chloroflexota bacterium]
MKDRRPVDELSVEELEEILRVRKREARLERLRSMDKDTESGRLDPLAPKPVEPRPTPLPTDYRRFQDVGATAQFRPRTVEDESRKTAEGEKAERQPRRVRWDWVRDKSLLVIELAVLAALVVVLLSLRETLQEVNREASQAQQARLSVLPTPTATPLIAVVLPGESGGV